MSVVTLEKPAAIPGDMASRLDAQQVDAQQVDALQVAQHQAALRDVGYTVFRDLIDPSALASMRQVINGRFASQGEFGHQPNYHSVNLVTWGPAFAATAAHPMLLATVEGLIGEDCILSSCNLGVRTPGCDAQGLHRDTHIWGGSLPFMSFPIGIQTAWCIDDFTLENGATRLIPGSHTDPAPAADRTGIQVVAPAGSVIAFDCQAFHAGEANRSAALRRGVLTFYIRSWLKPQTDHRRSFPPALMEQASPQLLRLLGFRRQSPVELSDGTSIIVPAPGATSFYDQPPAESVKY